jgi:hypothetical protein
VTARQGSVFISFKSEERATAAHLMTALQSHGFKVWWQEEIQCGQEWRSELDQAVRDADCIVVLWSQRAMASPWVKHEASQAMARSVYAPARIELVVIERPYDNIQATDLFDWVGDVNHPGFRELVRRIEQLIPPPVPAAVRLRRWAWRARATIAAATVAIAALGVLGFLASTVRGLVAQLTHVAAKEADLARDIDRSLHPIENIAVTVWLTVEPGVSADLEAYRTKLARALPAGLKKFPPGVESLMDNEVSIDVVGGALSPNVITDEAVYDALRFPQLTIAFFVRPRMAYARIPALDGSLAMDVGDLHRPPQIQFDRTNHTLQVQFDDQPAPQKWRSDGEIRSVNDIVEGAIRLDVRNFQPRVLGGEEMVPRIAAARSALRLDAILLKVSGREVWLRSGDLTEIHRFFEHDGVRTFVADMKSVTDPTFRR